MEKLEKSKQAELRKLSDIRLQSKLTQAGFTLELVENMDRAAMLDAYAELVLGGKEPTSSKTVVGYDAELEKRRLEFHMRQWEEERTVRETERAEREAQRQFELARIEAERADREAQRQLEFARLEAERVVRETERADREAERQVERDRIEVDRVTRENERSLRLTRPVQLKHFGNALKATITKMGNDPIEVVLFFDNIEKEFGKLEVPDGLRACLIKPFLNERAKTLVTQITSTRSDDYEYVKSYLLEEFRMVPSQLLDDYNHLTKPPQQSFKAYTARLRLLLSYYLNGKGVHSFEAMKDLFLCDRLKSTLSDSMLTHVLRAESALDKGSHLTSNALVELLDEFVVTFDKFGQAKSTPYAPQFQRKSGGAQTTGGQYKDHRPPNPSLAKSSQSVMAGNPGTRNTGDRACYRCGSYSHLANKCSLPRETDTGNKHGQPKVGQSTTRQLYSSGGPSAKVNRCIVNESNVHTMSTENSHATQPNMKMESIKSVDSQVMVIEESDDITAMPFPVNFSVSTVNACLQAEQPIKKPSVRMNCNVDELSRLQLAKLNYVDIKLPVGTVTALIDSGSELNVLRKEILREMDIDSLGEIEFRGIIGESVKAPIVRLPIRLSEDSLGDDDNVFAMFAICTDLNESCVISIPTFCLLNDMLNKKVCLSTNEHCDNMIEMSTVSAVTTRSQAHHNNAIVLSESCDPDCSESSMTADDGSDEGFIDVDKAITNIRSDVGVNNSIEFAKEQQDDRTLFHAWRLARLNKSNYFVRDDLLFHKMKRCDQTLELLVVPTVRRPAVVRLSHADSHFSPRHTKERIITSGLFWEGVLKDCIHHCTHCEVCQLRSRKTVWDRVPIKACVPESEPFRTMMMDCIGPIKPGVNLKFNYALIVVDVATRYPFCYPLRSLSAKNVCDALVTMFEFTSLPITIASDNGSNFRSSLTREMLRRFGISSRFATAYHPVSIVERQIGTLKSIIGKLVLECEKDWTTYLGPALFAMRTTMNENLGCCPHLLLFGHWPRGPLKYLSDTWSGQNCLPTNLSKTAVEYLENLQEKLKTTQHYASEHLKQEQNRHIQHYNRRARHKSFQPGDRCLILQSASTSSHALRRWKGPATIVEKLSEYSYLVEYNGTQYRLHANLLRMFHTQVNQVTCLPLDYVTIGNDPTLFGVEYDTSVKSVVYNCTVIFENDTDFGEVSVIDPSPRQRDTRLPSQIIANEKLAHLTHYQRQQVLEVLDSYPDVFSEVPGLCTLTQHEIPIMDSFKPKSLRPYKVPQQYQSEVSRQIKELLKLGFIEKSTSPQASPIIVCLKAKDSEGKRGVRIAIDYRYVNKHTVPSVAPLEDISEIVQEVGKSPVISTFDCKSGYHQCLVKPADRWLTSFVCEEGQFQWTRTPFGMRSSGNTFVRAMQAVLYSIKSFAKSYVDDIAVHSDSFESHLNHLEKFLQTVRSSGITLSIDKVELVKPKTKFLGSIIGSGERSVNPDKINAVAELREPESKRQLRQIIGFFSFFREFIPGFAMVCKPLTDLTSKRIPDRIPFGAKERLAFDTLKRLLCDAVNQPLCIIDPSKGFSLFVDASATAVGVALTQPGDKDDGALRPVAFASRKLNETQQNWSTLEREAYAALFGLQKYKYWLYGRKTILYSDHNPLLFLTESVPKSAKLMRWALALSEFDIEFRYRVGRQNEAADCLSRMVRYDGDDG